ncbi:MAG: glycoside hydrolase family 3 C-terminal domain-containing protein, partial [Oscillospiraceae bacterium]|nr:glycoside hydrolase family 3 C-terminal domain-containing protein [Oscillospiraceae bacterium]
MKTLFAHSPKRRFLSLLSVIALLLTCVVFALPPSMPQVEAAPGDPYENTSLSFEERAADLVSRMTEYEKLGYIDKFLVDGQMTDRGGDWFSQFGSNNASIPRLGVPAMNYWMEALHGVARQGTAMNRYSTAFTFNIGVGATWNRDLTLAMSTAIGDEARGFNNTHNVPLNYFSPTINIYRDPRWGRSDECYSEDPYMTAVFGQMFVDGFQGTDPKYEKVNSTIKHFLANNNENNRHGDTSDMDIRTLNEFYAYAFKSVTLNSRVASVMTAYNRVNGVPMSAHQDIVDTMLRRKWGFDGFVVTDCGAIYNIFNPQDHHYKPDANYLAKLPGGGGAYVDAQGYATKLGGTAMAMLAGTDMNCGDGYAHWLLIAMNNGLVSMNDIDLALTRIFTSRFKTGEFDPAGSVPYRNNTNYSWQKTVHESGHRQIAEDMADEAIVLLKNDIPEGGTKPLLPLSKSGPDKISKLVLVGEGVQRAHLGGYSRDEFPTYDTTPEQGFTNLLQGSGTQITVIGNAPPAQGLSQYVCNARNIQLRNGSSVLRTLTPSNATVLYGLEEEGDHYGYINPGAYIVFPNVDFTNLTNIRMEVSGPNDTQQGTLEFRVGSKNGYLLGSVETSASGGWTPYNWFQANVASLGGATNGDLYVMFISKVGGIDLTSPANKQAIEEADAVVYVAGTLENDSGEGHDRATLDLPRSQAQFIFRVLEMNPNTAVYIQSVSQVSLEDFIDKAPAILWSAYNGEAQGNAIARIVYGDTNPSGKLPFTWYSTLAELPSVKNYTIRGGGAATGGSDYGRTYQYFSGTADYPFGYGLSYTNYAYSNLSINKNTVTPDDTITVTFDVTNTGTMAGAEASQLYVTPPGANGIDRPFKMLKGFDKISLNPGQTKTVTLTLDVSDCHFYDNDGNMLYDQGIWGLSVGGSSASTPLSTTVELAGALTPKLQAVTVRPEGIVLSTAQPDIKFHANLMAALSDDSFLDLSASGVTVSYTSRAPGVATVNASGTVSPAGAGSTLITATVTYAGQSMSATFPVIVQGAAKPVDNSIKVLTKDNFTVSSTFPSNSELAVNPVTDQGSSVYQNAETYFGGLFPEEEYLHIWIYQPAITNGAGAVTPSGDVSVTIRITEAQKGARIYEMAKGGSTPVERTYVLNPDGSVLFDQVNPYGSMTFKSSNWDSSGPIFFLVLGADGELEDPPPEVHNITIEPRGWAADEGLVDYFGYPAIKMSGQGPYADLGIFFDGAVAGKEYNNVTLVFDAAGRRWVQFKTYNANDNLLGHGGRWNTTDGGSANNGEFFEQNEWWNRDGFWNNEDHHEYSVRPVENLNGLVLNRGENPGVFIGGGGSDLYIRGIRLLIDDEIVAGWGSLAPGKFSLMLDYRDGSKPAADKYSRDFRTQGNEINFVVGGVPTGIYDAQFIIEYSAGRDFGCDIDYHTNNTSGRTQIPMTANGQGGVPQWAPARDSETWDDWRTGTWLLNNMYIGDLGKNTNSQYGWDFALKPGNGERDGSGGELGLTIRSVKMILNGEMTGFWGTPFPLKPGALVDPPTLVSKTSTSITVQSAAPGNGQ